jgi:hypothetical protein
LAAPDLTSLQRYSAADLAAAERWHTKLLGAGPDHRPMPTLLHWELSDEGGLMLSSSEEIAARGAIFLYVGYLAAERRRLDGQGITLGDDNNEGEYSTLAQASTVRSSGRRKTPGAPNCREART